MNDSRPRRVAALVDGLTAAHLDGLLLTGLANIRYLTGFSGSSALLVVSQRDVVLITDFRYQTQVVDEVGDLARIVIEPSSLWTGLWQQLAQLGGLQVLGFETTHIPHRDFQRLSSTLRSTSSRSLLRPACLRLVRSLDGMPSAKRINPRRQSPRCHTSNRKYHAFPTRPRRTLWRTPIGWPT